MSLLLFLRWCPRWQGLGVPGGGAAAGGFVAGSKPADEKKKWKIEEKAAGADERKRPRLRTSRTTVVPQSKPAATSSFFDAPTSPVHDATADAGVNKEFTRSPSIEAEDVGNKTADQIFDTVDSFDNLIPLGGY
ncbi:hypothetical protein Hanom_Chr04g00343851 [Helianthus anomalus]